MRDWRISGRALEDPRIFFEARGREGYEGTAMLAGHWGEIRRCVIPDQIGRRSATGVSVEVTMTGKLQLAAALNGDELYVARIHSHPREPFHSRVDDENPGLTAQGSLSIVVGNYGAGLRRGLGGCAIYEFRGPRWVRLSSREVRRHLQVVG